MFATRIGQNHHLRGKLAYLLRVLDKLIASMSGLRYTRFVGDGDSSVHSTLLDNCNVPYGEEISPRLKVLIMRVRVTVMAWRS